MLLIELTFARIGEDDKIVYISNEYIDRPEQFYDAKVISFSNITLSTPSWHGGYAGVRFGNIVLMPDVFSDIEDWPPPKSIMIKAFYATDNLSSRQLMFDGKLHLTGMDETSVSYSLYPLGDDTTVTDKLYSGELITIFQDTCDRLGISLDSSLATNDPYGSISYTAYGEHYELDNLNDIAKTFSHIFYIEDNTLHLIDMYKDNTYLAIDGFDYFKVDYSLDRPISLFKGEANSKSIDTVFNVKGYFNYGNEYTLKPFCRDDPSSDAAESILIKLKDWAERYRITLTMPLDMSIKICQRIKIFDKDKYKDLVGQIRVRSITWDFNNDEMTLYGDGELD